MFSEFSVAFGFFLSKVGQGQVLVSFSFQSRLKNLSFQSFLMRFYFSFLQGLALFPEMHANARARTDTHTKKVTCTIYCTHNTIFSLFLLL